MTARAMTVKEAAAKVLSQEELFILDVRNPGDFADWKIEGKHFRHLNIPYFDLLDGVDEIMDRLPAGQEILVVCAKEGSSVMVAEMLSEAGLETAYLKGGMKAWSEHLEPVKVGELSGGGGLYQFVRVGKGCLSYMAVSDGEAAVIDAARMTEVYTDFAESLGARITHVLDTHLHADHISGGRLIAGQSGASYWLPPKDAEEAVFGYEALEDGHNIAVGSTMIGIHALYSPGHTIGSTSFLVDGQYLLSGDLLFIDSIGRPDLAGKAGDWAGDLRESLYKRYKQLPGNLTVLPAHFMTVDELGEDGSVSVKLEELFERNHGLQIEDESEFRRLVTENLPPQPNAYREIRETNQGKLRPDAEKQREMEIGPNRCAVR
ncbi:MBL fold metallo-hydrolase [Paenibacillus mucilaginosus]|uniref:YrkH n=1 Tax=Paenibacillus mucilaginosus (strain KNP414) TaxID=1036673 RepID=F8FJE0_PAEMK|nr:MBL fold metallo-hydrolase [Paenibacillus mucilaginosus]AEI39903.1 YrkH [Paenibacillus mucilaginosus KNP414]MCG7217222.1 MBL fold metallo-hydrolase [Paenibacillus mucilaginosus]WDM29177.1 MBL fold metallo-hydrolase [Paenibacillus mucilaginosus]